MKPLQIAIDGPVGAGKSDIAEKLARRLHLVHLYTGAMYRALTLACIEKNIDLHDSQQVISLLKDSAVDLVEPNENDKRSFKILFNQKDVTDAIFSQAVTEGVPIISAIPEVRRIMVKRQQSIAEGKRVVMEGRDIGLRVLPHAQLKIYLTASLEERAKRRWLQLQKGGLEKSIEEIQKEVKERDYQDMHREADPLQKLPDAWELDTTGLTQDEVVAQIVDELEKRSLL